jgi:4-hydroxy-tetrahydrodipicolinate reductase
MNIALIGYGRMGHEIEEIAVSRGHTIMLVIDIDNTGDINKEKMKDIDVVIEFSSPHSAFENISKCLDMKIPVVSGTTGWLHDYDRAADLCKKNRTAFIHSSNYSIGVNLLFRINSELAKQISRYKDYTVSIEEIHHTKKLDAPSGTAISLAEGIKKRHPSYKGWCFENEKADNLIPIRSVREGVVPGTHTVSWDSVVDNISISHDSKSRK